MDDKLSAENDDGELVYAPTESEDSERREVNVQPFEIISVQTLMEDFQDVPHGAQEEVLRRIKEAASGQITQRWDAPRSDE